MCESTEKCLEQNDGFSINFNQDYSSLAVVGQFGFRLFTITSVERVEEIFCSNNEDTKIAERLFSSSLVAVVTATETEKLKIWHFKKGTEICNYRYPSAILSVRLNRNRLVVCLRDSIYVHNIRDMRLMNSIRHIAPNDSGLCSLSLQSHLAFPVSNECGELQLYDAENMRVKIKIKAHDSPLSAFNFSPNGQLLATASEKGTVIRVFCVKNGQKVHEFRRGMKRCVRIASLNFSGCSNYLCVSSNTETVHVFKIDLKLVEEVERQNCINNNDESSDGSSSVDTTSSGDSVELNSNSNNRWSMGFFTKYLPSPVSDVLTQDRAFSSVQLNQAGLRYQCAIAKLEKESKLLAACEDGFLYVYDFDANKGGDCKLIRAHDLRSPLDGITDFDFPEVNMDENNCNRSKSPEKKSITASVGSYASVLKGREKNKMSDSDKRRDLFEAIEYPPKTMFEEVQFPPVTSVRAE
ncbi:WD repeat domain phosphoinositide-interacting protein 2 isoform X2 [Contarinia nasturtii]|uniref:WD repeat domain phosphoinositide-interacting protein 2 isoform X2 n=1 Tax=Contarinia nasturtii TaxID=265458 RepID=UPI0012D3DF7E|nr:WD repeat domain phosphoinositide-interacting protein 2 isoform X2 [Contarinia nasturtii]